MDAILVLPILVSFLLTAIFLPKWIKKCKNLDLFWEDMNKFGHPRNVAASGGLIVIMSFILGILVYIAIRTFVFKNLNGISLQIFSLLCVIIIMSLVGLTDDFLGWKKGGLSWKFRIFLAISASVPLIVINAGQSLIDFPFFGIKDVGLFYPLLLIPLGITGAASTYNFLAGFNGLEAGQGIIIISFLSFISYLTGTSWLALVGLCMVASLIVFYIYNRVPAKVFPGDVLTWSVGALIAGMAILGNFEKIAVFVFIPYIIEFVLKVRGGFSPAKQSFGIPNKENGLAMPYNGKIYGLTHFSIYLLSKFKKQVREKDVVYLIFSFQILICLLTLVLFKSILFS